MKQLIMPWRLDEPKVSPETFFRLVPGHFGVATHIYVEGCAMAPDVEKYYLSANETGEFVPGANTIWPESSKYRLPFSSSLLAVLAKLAGRHSTSELLDHVFVYRGDTPLLYWHDAFENQLWLGASLSQAEVQAVASALGTQYELVAPDGPS